MFREPVTLLMSLPGLLVAITFHELAHGYVADILGDPTPRAAGRLSLNPLVHLDFVGTLMLIVFRFGWAKPVPINPMFFADRDRGMLFTALAGPAANVSMAFVATYILMQFGGALGPVAATIIWYMLMYNIWLGVFNMLPVPPLDGSRILRALATHRSALGRFVMGMEQYGWVVLMILLVTGLISSILMPVAGLVRAALEMLAGLLVI